MTFDLNSAALEYARGCHDEAVELIKTMCRIPAPSGDEARRAEFCRRWFESAGADDVYIDDALNCVCRLNYRKGGDVIVFMAHTDTVFPDLEPFEPVESDGRLHCPGVGDDTANLALLMLCARYFIRVEAESDCGVLFVANSGEEGLGNLKGCRKIMEDYAGQVRLLVSLDGGLGHACNGAVGSERYNVKLTAQGGHSYGKFGSSNAIHLLSLLIAELYQITPPVLDGSKTTYNVGLISGGTSINTIAQTAEMLYEYRSTSHKCLAFMRESFNSLVEKYREKSVALEIELLGSRPCMGDVPEAEQRALENRLAEVVHAVTGKALSFAPASTDCNIPFSLGVPAICTGGYIGEGAHRREEWIELESLRPGIEVVMGFISSWFE